MNQDLDPTTSQPRRHKQFERTQALKAVVAVSFFLGVFECFFAPSVETFLLVAGILGTLGITIAFGIVGAKMRFLNVAIRPQLGLLIISTVLALAGCEISLRLWRPLGFPELHRTDDLGRNLGYRYDRTLGWFPVPNQRSTFAAETTISISNNRLGFRDSEPKQDGKPCIVCVGDSFVWGFNVEANQRFTEKLQARHPEWRICNWGVCGYSTDQEYLVLQKHLAAFHPKLVILIFCVENDEEGNCLPVASSFYFKPYFVVEGKRLLLRNVPVPRSERVLCLQHPIFSKLFLTRLVFRACARLAAPTSKIHASPTQALLREIDQFVTNQGARLIVGLTDSSPDLEKFLRHSGIECLDLRTSLRFRNDPHWTPEGHTFVAQRIEEMLVRNNYLPRR